MPIDKTKKMIKKDFKRYDESSKNRKRNHESSDDDDADNDNNSFYTDESDEEEMDDIEYRKFLKKLFPSRYLDKKIASGEKIKELLEDDYESEYDSDDDEDYIPKKSHKSKKINKQNTKKPQKKHYDSNSNSDSDYDSHVDCESDSEKQDISLNKKKKLRSKYKKQIITDSDSDSESESEYNESNDDESVEELDDEFPNKEKNKTSKFNIIFTVGTKDTDIDAEDDDWETCSKTDTNTENEDDPISTDEDSDNDCIKRKKTKKQLSSEEKTKNKENLLITKLKDALDLNTCEKVDDNEDLIKVLKDLQAKNKNNKLINECIRFCDKNIQFAKQKNEKKLKKEKERNSRIFKKILRDKNTMNDIEFYDKMETTNQKKLIKELREINKITRIEKPYRLTLLESNIPVTFKATAMKKLSSLRYMEPGSGEYYKIKHWIDAFMRIPFGEYKTLPLSIDDGIDKCHDFMANAQKTLDDAVYGLNDAKMQIMQLLGQLITNPSAIGSAIAIHGPPGTGKTSLVKEGISKILNRPFAFIALGGATDSSFLEGHGYTYEGSTWGKIVQILIDSKCMNPVIYFDELDKISDTPKGEEIAGILTHLTDTSQNSQFHDKYFAEIDFDLSKCLFIFSYNDESKVNPILKDRMYRIQTKGYSPKQKTSISNNYLLPKIREQVKFTAEDIIIPDQTLNYIIENYCNKEDGVRNLKRCLEIVYTKLNLYRLMRPDTNLFENEMSLKVEFPFTVTKDIVDKLIKKTNEMNPSLYHLYV
jgi:ATP-dependent Lon protease